MWSITLQRRILAIQHVPARDVALDNRDGVVPLGLKVELRLELV
jgi:hypothetical protein